VNDWVPIIVGYGIILVAIIAARAMPNSTIGVELRRSYGVTPSGDRGHRTREDYLKSAGLAFAASVGLALTCMGAGVLMDRYPIGSRANLAASTYSFGAFLLMGVALLLTAGSLWRYLFFRVVLPDTPAHRLSFADAIDRLLDGAITDNERIEHLEVRYKQREIEEIRRSTLKLVRKHGVSLPENHRSQIRQLTAGIRASAILHQRQSSPQA
jgi:hypothetical protein